MTREGVADVGFGAAWSLVKALPEPMARAMFAGGAEVGWRRQGAGVAQLRANLRRVIPAQTGERDLEDLVRRGLRSYGRYWMETFRLPVLRPADVIARTEVSNWQYFDAMRHSGRGIVAALTHSGNWEASAIVYADRLGEGFTTVAERLRPESVYRRFVGYRERLGMEVLPLTGGSRPVAAVLAERLRAGRCVCLLAERDLAGAGIEVDFFGEPAGFPPGPALLAATTGAALLAMNGSFTPTGWRMDFAPEVVVPAQGRLRERVQVATQSLARIFERGIAAHPEDWHMLQPLWRADGAPRRVAGS